MPQLQLLQDDQQKDDAEVSEELQQVDMQIRIAAEARGRQSSSISKDLICICDEAM